MGVQGTSATRTAWPQWPKKRQFMLVTACNTHDAQPHLHPDSSRLPDPVIPYCEHLNIITDKLTEVKAETVQQHLPHLSPQLAQIPPQLLDPLLQTQVCMANLQMQKSDPCAICTYVCIHTNKSRTKHSWYTSHTSQCGFQSITITWQLLAEVLLYAVCKSKQRSVLWCLTAHT